VKRREPATSDRWVSVVWWWCGAVVVLVVSFVNPFTIPGAPLAMILVLDLMHVIAAAIIVGVLTTLPVKR